MSGKLVRLSMSLEESLYDKLESLVKSRNCKNRSEFIRDMVRDRLVEDEWGERSEVVGTITLVYDHHRHETGEKLTELQHHKRHNILAATHIHLSDDICAEMIMLRGSPQDIRALADAMRSQKGVLHANLTMSSTGVDLD